MDLPALPEHENRWPQNVYTLLEAIESDTSPADYQLLHDWLLVCARLIGEVAAMLKDISGNLHV